MRGNPLPVTSTGDVGHPIVILKIPANGFAKSTLQRLFRSPSQLPLNLARIHRVSPIVPRPILHICDEFFARISLAWRHLIDQIADRLNDFDVGLLVPAPNVVGIAGSSLAQHSGDGVAMILHVEPVANVLAVAVHWQWLAVSRIQNDQRNQLLRKLKSPIIVRAVRGQRWQTERVVIRPYQMVR